MSDRITIPELEPARIVFDATERTIKVDGQKLLIPEIEKEDFARILVNPINLR